MIDDTLQLKEGGKENCQKYEQRKSLSSSFYGDWVIICIGFMNASFIIFIARFITCFKYQECLRITLRLLFEQRAFVDTRT